LVANIKMCIGF